MGHQYKTPGLQEDLDFILDVFSGGDNGAFLDYLMMLRNMDELAANGDKDAAAVVAFTTKFARGIRVATRHRGNANREGV